MDIPTSTWTPSTATVYTLHNLALKRTDVDKCSKEYWVRQIFNQLWVNMSKQTSNKLLSVFTVQCKKSLSKVSSRLRGNVQISQQNQISGIVQLHEYTYSFQFTFRYSADTVCAKVCVPGLNTSETAEVLISLLLPLGYQILVGNVFLQAVFIQFCNKMQALKIKSVWTSRQVWPDVSVSYSLSAQVWLQGKSMTRFCDTQQKLLALAAHDAACCLNRVIVSAHLCYLFIFDAESVNF